MGQPYVGEIRIFGGDFAPRDWAFCNGQLLSIEDFEELFTLIGTIYGGDGETTFALPDLRSRVPVGQGTALGKTWAMGELAGVETVTLTAQQMPNHTHSVLAGSGPATSASPSGNVWAAWGDAPYSSSPPTTPMSPVAVAAVGNAMPHENRAPALGTNFIISLFGIFPSFKAPPPAGSAPDDSEDDRG